MAGFKPNDIYIIASSLLLTFTLFESEVFTNLEATWVGILFSFAFLALYFAIRLQKWRVSRRERKQKMEAAQ